MEPASKQRFRLKLIFDDELACLHAIRLNGVPSPAGHEAVGGMARGKEDLVSLITDVGIDSVVQTRQLGERALGDAKLIAEYVAASWRPPNIEHTFSIRTPSEIIGAIEGHFAAYHESEERIISAHRQQGRPRHESL